MESKTKKYVGKQELKTQRGWTDAAIKALLGPPDLTTINSISGAKPLQLFLRNRVIEIENSRAFQDFAAADNKKAKQAAIKARRLQALETTLSNLEFTVRQLDLDQLFELAVKHYTSSPQGKKFAGMISRDSDPAFLARITVNYLRHHCTQYEDLMSFAVRQGLKTEAFPIIRAKVYAAIKSAYPHLADECDRQKTVRFSVAEWVEPPSTSV